MNLYEISRDLQMLQAMLEENPEDESLQDTLEGVEYEFDLKCENYVKVIRNIQADVDAIANEIKRLQAKKATAERGIEKLRHIMQEMMIQSNKEKAGGALFTISLRNSAPKLPEDLNINDVPIEYIIPQEPKIDKRELLKAVKAGKVDGINLVTTKSLNIR